MKMHVTVHLYGPVGNPEEPKTIVENTFTIDLGPQVTACRLISSIKSTKNDCIMVYFMKMADSKYAAGQYIIPNTQDYVVVEMGCISEV